MKSTLVAAALLCAAIPEATAEPGPGDVYVEYVWRGPHRNADGWQRVTHPEAPDPRAQVYVPNPVNRIKIPDLDDAIAAEVNIQQWGGHTGTSDKAMRINDNQWLTVPHPQAIPGNSGRARYDRPECYQYFTYTSIPVPLEHLQSGDNHFEFTSGDQTCFGFGWGQWGVYAVVFRIYLDSARPHPTGRITSPLPGDVAGDSLRLEASADSPDGTISSVDFIGHYEDYDYDGDGIWREWHYIYQSGHMRRHLGTADSHPFVAAWDMRWVPDQEEPMSIIARIRDDSGVYYMTEPVNDVTLDRGSHSVQMYKPYNVPPSWISRSGRTKTAQTFVPQPLSAAVEARALITTWSGAHAEAVGINDSTLVPRVGKFHDYGHSTIDVPLHLLRSGSSRFFTASSTEHHGIEVMWPGITLFVRYSDPSPRPPPASEDLPIFADDLLASWTAITPADGSALAESRDDALEGSRVLRVEPSETFNSFLQLKTQPPQPIAGFTSLRLSIHPNGMRLETYHRLNLEVWDTVLPLIKKGESLRGLDFADDRWQTLDIPLDEIDFRFPFLETLNFEGRLDDAFLIDDVRLISGNVQTAVTMTGAGATRPAALRLYPNNPNPFNSQTSIAFDLPQPGPVRLSVYNIAGQIVATLLDETLPAGRHQLSWNGRDTRGRQVATGVYFYRLETLRQSRTHRLLLLR